MKPLKYFLILSFLTLPFEGLPTEDVGGENPRARPVQSFGIRTDLQGKEAKAKVYESLKNEAIALGVSTDGGIGALKARIREFKSTTASAEETHASTEATLSRGAFSKAAESHEMGFRNPFFSSSKTLTFVEPSSAYTMGRGRGGRSRGRGLHMPTTIHDRRDLVFETSGGLGSFLDTLPLSSHFGGYDRAVVAPHHKDSRGRGRGSFRGKHRETPEEYEVRKERIKLSSTREYAKELGISVSSYSCKESLERAIQVKKGERALEYAKEKLLRTQDYARKLGILVSSYSSQEDLEEKIQRRKELIKKSEEEGRKAERREWESMGRKEREKLAERNSLGRMVGDGRGGEFFAIWGKDDN